MKFFIERSVRNEKVKIMTLVLDAIFNMVVFKRIPDIPFLKKKNITFYLLYVDLL